ncbi:MAG: hypothetical protein KDK65_06855, partial [Chlamydiia bacterium]|nr:hypothetical protein [Chlamydiia bacterium]
MDKIIQNWPMLSDILLSTADWLAINQSTEFFKHRTAKSLVRQILSFSWMKSEILYSGVNLEEQPVVEFRLISVHLNLPFGMKQTTGLCIICKNVNDYQILNERGILKAVGASVPNAQTVQATYFNISLPNTTTRLIYIEFEKSDG